MWVTRDQTLAYGSQQGFLHAHRQPTRWSHRPHSGEFGESLVWIFERYVTKFASHQALKSTTCVKLTFDERVVLHRVVSVPPRCRAKWQGIKKLRPESSLSFFVLKETVRNFQVVPFPLGGVFMSEPTRGCCPRLITFHPPEVSHSLKTPTPMGPPQGPRHSPTVGS